MKIIVHNSSISSCEWHASTYR